MEAETKKSRDLTEFFLEWRDTCAINLCTRKDDVRYVHDMFDNRAKRMIADCRDSELGGGVVAVSEFSGSSGHWFNRVESEFYRQGEKTPEEGGKKFGQALKDHLFGNEETIASPGRLNGYFLGMLRTVVNASFKGSVVSVLEQDKDGKKTNPIIRQPDPNPDGDPESSIARKECLADFRKHLLAFWNEAAIDMRLAALCFATAGEVPFSNPVVVEASGLKSSAFANRKERVVLELRKIAGSLSKDHDSKDLQTVVGKNLRDLLEEFGREDSACAPFFQVA